jgi:hypothetical protein
MIVIEKKNGTSYARVWTEEPNIYMDMWALTMFAQNQTLQRQFFETFNDRGTLLISTMLAVEIGANQATAWPEMRALLHGVGSHWLPLTIDAFAVMEAQENHGSAHAACISHGFINDPKFSSKLRAGDLSLGNVVDLTRGPDGVELKASMDADTTELAAAVRHHREAHRADAKYLSRQWKNLPWHPTRSMRAIYNAFVRLTVKDSFTFDDNHARDMFHAIASVGCAHITLLDSHWAEQARKVEKQFKSPPGFAKVYDPSQLQQFLADLAAWPHSRGSQDPNI